MPGCLCLLLSHISLFSPSIYYVWHRLRTTLIIDTHRNDVGNKKQWNRLESAVSNSYNYPTNSSCVNWNQYYTNCTQLGRNPFHGTISFDNIGMAWVAIFLVISLEGWTDIMYYVQDAHSFWDWIYFVLLIVVRVRSGSNCSNSVLLFTDPFARHRD